MSIIELNTVADAEKIGFSYPLVPGSELVGLTIQLCKNAN